MPVATPIRLPTRSTGVVMGVAEVEQMVKGLRWNFAPSSTSGASSPATIDPAASGVVIPTSAESDSTIASEEVPEGPPGMRVTSVKPASV